MQYKVDSSGSTVVSPECKWLRIDENTPFGKKMLLIHENTGVAVFDRNQRQGQFTHWFPLPTFGDTDEGKAS